MASKASTTGHERGCLKMLHHRDQPFELRWSTTGFTWIRSSYLLILCTCHAIWCHQVCWNTCRCNRFGLRSLSCGLHSRGVSASVWSSMGRRIKSDGDVDWNKPNLKLSRLTSTNFSELELLVHGISQRSHCVLHTGRLRLNWSQI